MTTLNSPSLTRAFIECTHAADNLRHFNQKDHPIECRALDHINNALIALHDAGVDYPSQRLKAKPLSGGLDPNKSYRPAGDPNT